MVRIEMTRRQGAAAMAAILTVIALTACGSGRTTTTTVTVPAGNVTVTGTTATGTASTTTTAATSTTATQPASSGSIPAPSGQVSNVSTFLSPSGNIGCVIAAGVARCDIKNRNWSPPPTPKTCPPVVDYGQGLDVNGSGPGRFVCAGDTAIIHGSPALAYGTDTVVGPFRCFSRANGMTCENTSTGHGFFISIQGYRAF